MKSIFRCLIYLALTAFGSFVAGRCIPKQWLAFERFPYRPFPMENGGRIYAAMGIQRWKDLLPDMSKIFPWAMPSKKMPNVRSAAKLEVMVQETCVAELIHVLLCVSGFGCVPLWHGAGGWLMAILFALGNLPFILIQRYNRPKLIRVMKKLRQKERVPEHELTIYK